VGLRSARVPYDNEEAILNRSFAAEKLQKTDINLSGLAPLQIAKAPTPGRRRKELGTYSLQRLRQPTGL
jgi:hypothetical protein